MLNYCYLEVIFSASKHGDLIRYEMWEKRKLYIPQKDLEREKRMLGEGELLLAL